MYDKLTKSDIEKMESEIEYRKTVLRPELLVAVKEARAQGDLSDNFEYYAAKKEKNKNESRIRYLDRMVRTADLIEDDSEAGEVGMNNIVEIYFEDEKTTETYKIVTTIRQNSLQGMVSIDSPLGKALLKHRVNDRVYVKVNDEYGYYVVIKSIDNSNDDSSDKLRNF